MEGASRTAQVMALQRALETNRPSPSRLFADPYAAAFTRGGLAALARFSAVPFAGRAALRVYDAVAGPGPRPSAVVRTRLIDDVVRERVAEGAQVVLLGAGYDTRAHRLAELRSVAVFEVDHPDTQRVKRSVVRRLGLPHDHVRYVPLDFETRRLAEALTSAGFRAGALAVVVWEGVTNYLTAEAVDATLADVRRIARGGRLVFTYVHAGVLDGSADFPEAARWVRGVRRAGEPWTFGLRPQDVEGYLADRGYRLLLDVSTAVAGEPWFAELGRRERASELYRVAVAEPRRCHG